MTRKLEGKTAIVTGGSGGLGSAFSLALANAGANVGVAFIGNPAPANELVLQIQALGVKSIALEADITDPAAVKAIFAQADSELGMIDILVNNAGIDGVRARAWEVDAAKWRKTLEVNLFGAFHCAQEALSRMVVRKSGVIINITSVHEVIPWGGYSAYTASKAGLGMLTKTLAQEAAEFNVRVLALAPGAVQTPINQSVWSDAAGLADLNKKIPMGRMGQPDEIGRVLVNLASDDSSYLTGTTVFVDGGMTLYADFAHGG
jgi:glucose 1-dehydrogenase